VIVRRTAAPKVYVPAIGPVLRILLYVVFAIFAILGATGVYLAAVTAFNWYEAPQSYTTAFTLWIFLAHIAIGVIGTLPFLVFSGIHLATAWKRPNRLAVRLGVVLLLASLAIILTGFALVQLDGLPQLPTGTNERSVIYWLHVVVPFVAVWLYVLHRRAGPPIKWRLAKGWSIGVGAFTAVMVLMHSQDPQAWFREGPKEGAQYFEPSLARTADGKFISEDVLMMDDYCKRCHADTANDHFHSSHKFSSFNNPAYLFSVRQTREVAQKRDGNVKASRWCAGCHDPVPFYSGAFDNPNFDDVNDKTAHAGITCTSCHAITHVNGTIGNAAYTIEEPAHYPFAQSKDPFLQWTNNQVVKAKPDFHKQTFLKPFHKTAEFCATCHKVSLPTELNHYKEFLRGQNHYDPFLLSGVSGGSARAFYYPPQGKENCAQCHMPLQPSSDFGAKDFDKSGERKVHSHRFPAANTGLFELLKKEDRYHQNEEGFQKTIDMHTGYLQGKAADGSDKKLRIDIFGLKPGGTTDPATLIAPLRPQLPPLEPGKSYVVEVVIRTLGVGHAFSQGTVDSNEIWVDFQATAGGVEIARNGAMAGPNDTGKVDEWSHFINVLMLDREGNRINRRNPQDIFTPLYDKQIPPGAAAVLHYRVDVPSNVTGPVELSARVRYRKFDDEYMRLVYPGKEPPKLPVIDMCEDKLTLPLGKNQTVPAQTSPIKPAWQRWNDYGIGCLLEGGTTAKRGHFRQAEDAFGKLLTLGEKDAVPHGHVNLARVYLEEGRLEEAAKALDAAGKCDPPAPWWTLAWFTAQVNSETATRKEHVDDAIADLERIVDPDSQPRDRGFNFTKDYVVWNRLANRLFKRAQFETPGSKEQLSYLARAIVAAGRVLDLEAEDVEAHDLLKQCFARLSTEPPRPSTRKATELLAFGITATDTKKPNDKRIEDAHTFAAEFSSAEGQKLPVIRELAPRLRDAYLKEHDAKVQTALASALAALHETAHAIFKPDELARSNATRIYRESHPAANYAARDRVVYPTTPTQKDAIQKTGNLPDPR